MGKEGLYKLYIANYHLMVWVLKYVATVNDRHFGSVYVKATFNIKLLE